VSKKRFASVSVTTEIAAGQVTNIDVPLGQNADLQKVPQPNRSSFFHRLFRAYVDDWKLNTVRGADPARREVRACGWTAPRRRSCFGSCVAGDQRQWSVVRFSPAAYLQGGGASSCKLCGETALEARLLYDTERVLRRCERAEDGFQDEIFSICLAGDIGLEPRSYCARN
jgi:hypothetical protein